MPCCPAALAQSLQTRSHRSAANNRQHMFSVSPAITMRIATTDASSIAVIPLFFLFLVKTDHRLFIFCSYVDSVRASFGINWLSSIVVLAIGGEQYWQMHIAHRYHFGTGRTVRRYQLGRLILAVDQLYSWRSSHHPGSCIGRMLAGHC